MLDLLALDRHRTLVLVDAVAVEHAHLDDRPRHARRQPERRIAHVRRLFAEDRAEQLLFGRHRAFALGRDLAGQAVSRLAPIGTAPRTASACQSPYTPLV